MPHCHIKHINGAEGKAIQKAYLQCHEGKNAIHWGNLVADRDAETLVSVNAAREECGETRPTEWQFCFLHVLKGSHRRLRQKLFSKSPVEVHDPEKISTDPNHPFQCPRCGRNFKTSQGRSVHLHACKVPSSQTVKTKLSPMDELCKANNLTGKESKPFVKKLSHWFMLRKLGELKRGVRSYAANRCYKGENDLELKARLRKAAATIVPCLSGDHRSCSSSFVCTDSIDPYLKCLPHQRNIPVLPKSIQIILRESILDVFSATKLDALVKNSKIRTTSNVESVHRTIRNPAAKNKPLFRNETPVLKMGATIAATRGKGAATLKHFRAMNIPISARSASKFQRFDKDRRQHSLHRQSDAYRKAESRRRRKRFLNHAESLASEERNGYRKEGFSIPDHTYASSSSKSTVFYICYQLQKE